MFAIKSSTATSKSSAVVEVPRTVSGEDNEAWFRHEVERLDAEAQDGVTDATFVLLLGGRSPIDFRVRVAQSHLRADLTPSHWSHAALVRSVGVSAGETVLLEAALEPPTGFRMPVATNGVQHSYLQAYADPSLSPNIGLLRIPVERSHWLERPSQDQESLLGQFVRQRVIVDVPRLVLTWLGFVWGVGGAGNPILAGAGLPSSVVIESLLSAAGFDLSPGLDSQTSTPEAFWQAALWWHQYYDAQGQGALSGSWCIDDKIELAAPRRSFQDATPVPDLPLG